MMTNLAKTDSNVWVIRSKPNPQAVLRLFCFPYAGSSAIIFRPWTDLPAAIEVCSVELPGRGTRFAETPFTRLDPLVEAIAIALLPYLDNPFAFFGHSMGALISFELARFLHIKQSLNPAHIFVSAYRAPQIPDPDPPIHTLPKSAFLEELRRLNGTPKAILENSELMQLILPILRADFAVLETYVYATGLPLNCPIAVFGGLQDSEVTSADLEAWQCQTNVAFSLQMLPGDHFFVHSERSLLLQKLSEKLSQLASVAAQKQYF